MFFPGVGNYALLYITLSLPPSTGICTTSRFSYKIWSWGLYLTGLLPKKRVLQTQQLMGYKRYEPVWLMMQMIRISMGHRDSLH